MYAAKTRTPNVDYFADIRSKDGVSWAHVRTNLGRKVAYAMMAKHFGLDCKIENFRDKPNSDDKAGLLEGSDGTLRYNEFHDNSSRYESYIYAK